MPFGLPSGLKIIAAKLGRPVIATILARLGLESQPLRCLCS